MKEHCTVFHDVIIGKPMTSVGDEEMQIVSIHTTHKVWEQLGFSS